MLELKNIDCFYGNVQVLRDVSLDRRRRRGALPARAQRRRQDHDAEGHHGAAPPRAGSILLDGVDLTALARA